MSGQIVIENSRLVAEQGTAVKTVIVVENGTLDDVEITAVEGVAFNFDVDTGEVTLSSNALGTHEILVGFAGEEAQDVIVLDVIEDTSDEEQPTNEQPTTQPPVVEPVVETPPPVVEQPPVVEVKAPAEAPAPVVQQAPAVEAPVEHPKEIAELMRGLEDYKSKMTLRTMVPTDVGVVQQGKLFRIIMKVLNKEGNDFSANMNALVNFVKANRDDVFSERAINRFIPQVKMNKEEILLFTRLTAMLLTCADVEDRKLVSKRIDFKFIEQRMNNGKAMQRLINFFNPATE